jgi:outer membrane protein
MRLPAKGDTSPGAGDCIISDEPRMNPLRILFPVLWVLPLVAQQPLTLADAVKQALEHHPSLEAAAARVQAAQARIEQARSGFLPKVEYQESVLGGNNPVYVFGALLTQRQFTAANFDINKLNSPDWTPNYQSQLTVQQTVWDFGATRHNREAATLGRAMTEQQRRGLEQNVVAGVARAYHGITLAREALDVAGEALKTAQADLDRAGKLRAAGMITDADVLSLKVYVSAMLENRIRRKYDLEVAQAALNEALGLPLDTPHDLTTPLTAAKLPASEGYEQLARTSRPELLQTRLAAQMASEQAASARSMLWPMIGVRGVFEADRHTFVTQGGANWMLGASLHWNLFDGNRTRQMAAEANDMAAAARATERQLESAVALQVRKARADAMAANEQLTVSENAVTQADESLRILRNRYENGLATVTDLLRAETALNEAKMRRLSAVYDQRMAAVQLEQSAGTLNGASDVLQ